MAEENKTKAPKSPLIGAQAQPTTLDKSTKLDIDVNKTLVDNIIDAGISGGLDIGKIEDFTSISNARDQIYQLIDNMAADSTVSAILKTYAEEVCEVSDSGHIVWCESADPNISKFVNYLLNVMNVDKNVYSWTYCLLKYGDVYLKLYRESDYSDPVFKKDNVDAAYSAKTRLNEEFNQDFDLNDNASLLEKVNLNIHKAYDAYSYHVEMVPDPGTMYELTKYGRTYGFIETPNEEHTLNYTNNYLGASTTQASAGNFNFRLKSNDVNIYQADDYVHGCLEDNFTRYPETVDLFMTDDDLKNNINSTSYVVKRGKSLLFDSYKVWREKALLENSILLNRLTKSSIVRNIQVEVGDMPKSQVQNTLRRVKELFEQKSAVNVGSGMVEYANPGPVENNVYTAVHNGQGAISVNSVGGDVEVKNLADLDVWVNKFYAAYGIPKAYFGYTDDGAGFNGGTSLAILSSVFAKAVKRTQNAIIQMITDAINLFLINKGCKSYINNFVLKMKAPLTPEEKDYRENLSARVSAISNTQALFADIEDKVRRLEVLKELISTLNYGDGLTEIIQEEIDASKKAEEENEENDEANGDNEKESTGGKENDFANLDLDLGNSSQAPMESFENNGGSDVLVEGQDFSEHASEKDFIKESDELPTPEEANSHVDFTQNN